MAQSIELIVPKLGESITEAIIARWLKRVGEPVQMDEPLAELETDKVTVTLPSPSAGVLAEQKHPEGSSVQVGESIGAVTAGDGAAVAAPPAAPAQASAVASAPAPVAAPPAPAAAPPTPLRDTAGRPLSPSQRRALLEHPDAAPVSVHPAAPAARPAPSAPAAPVTAGADEEVVAMSPLRRTIAARLVEAQHTAAILTTFNEVDMTAVMELRARFQDDFTKRHGVKLGFMSFFAKACVESLKEFPGLNAEMRGTSIVYKKHYDLGIAVGGGKGLVVPVLRGVDRLGFAEIEKKVADLGTRAKESKLTLEELSGGTFSITNGGIYGSMMSTPLLNMPQTGILGMHNIVRRAVVVGSGAAERVEIRPMMYLALSYDHRVVDGREAVQFLVAVKQRIESPDRLLVSI